MLTNDSKGIQKFIFERLGQIHEEILMNDSEYKELGKNQAEIFKQLFAKLTPEDSKMLDKYDSGRMNQMNRQDEIIFSQGLMDGMALGYWVAVVVQGSGKIVI